MKNGEGENSAKRISLDPLRNANSSTAYYGRLKEGKKRSFHINMRFRSVLGIRDRFYIRNDGVFNFLWIYKSFEGVEMRTCGFGLCEYYRSFICFDIM